MIKPELNQPPIGEFSEYHKNIHGPTTRVVASAVGRKRPHKFIFVGHLAVTDAEMIIQHNTTAGTIISIEHGRSLNGKFIPSQDPTDLSITRIPIPAQIAETVQAGGKPVKIRHRWFLELPNNSTNS